MGYFQAVDQASGAKNAISKNGLHDPGQKFLLIMIYKYIQLLLHSLHEVFTLIIRATVRYWRHPSYQKTQDYNLFLENNLVLRQT